LRLALLEAKTLRQTSAVENQVNQARDEYGIE
jgi:hypothetical protein